MVHLVLLMTRFLTLFSPWEKSSAKKSGPRLWLTISKGKKEELLERVKDVPEEQKVNVYIGGIGFKGDTGY